MASIVDGNKRNPITNGLAKKEQTDMTYGLPTNLPNLGTQVIETAPNNVPASVFAGYKLVFPVPRKGLWFNNSFRTLITNTNTGSSARYVDNLERGSDLYETIKYKTANRTLLTHTPYSLSLLMDGCGTTESSANSYYANNSITWDTNNLTHYLGTPQFANWWDAKECYLDTFFHEAINAECVINPAIKFGFTTVSTVTGWDAKMYSSFVVFEDKYANALKEANLRGVEPLVTFDWSTHTEEFPLTASATSTIIQPHWKGNTIRMGIEVRDDLNATKYDLSNNFATDVTITVKFSGEQIYSTIPVEVMNYNNSRYGSSGALSRRIVALSDVNSVAQKTVRPYILDFTLPQSCREYLPRNGYNGSVAMLDQTSPTITITHRSLASNLTLYLTSIYYQPESTDKESGFFIEAVSD